MSDKTPLLKIREISKRFDATQALDRVSFDLESGEVHSLVGENGAGKSTLIKILNGAYPPDSGQIMIDGREQKIQGPQIAQDAGIVVIPQDMQLIPSATIAENITLGNWPERHLLGFIPIIDKHTLRQRATQALQRLNFSKDPNLAVSRLTIAERQLVAIAKALTLNARILILDEPSASLERRETERLFDIIRNLKKEGVGIIYVSHFLDEIVELSDRCTILRDGKVLEVCEGKNINQEELIRLISGQDLEELQRPHKKQADSTWFQCEIPIDSPPVPGRAPSEQDKDHSKLHLRQGEILGLAGLLGSGTSEFLFRLFGAGEKKSTLAKGDKDLELKTPSQAIQAGIGLVPGQRNLGLVMGLSVRDNIILPHLERFSKTWRLDYTAIDELVNELIEMLDIRPGKLTLPVRALSGGNQQKVIFARWLVGKVDLLLLDEPTQGIDVGTKAKIHRIMHEFVENKGVILMSSSEMMEVVSISDRVLAMRKGTVVGRMSREDEEYSESYLRALLGGEDAKNNQRKQVR